MDSNKIAGYINVDPMMLEDISQIIRREIMGMCDIVMDARNDVMLQAMNASIEGGVKSEDIKRFTLKHIPNDPMRDNLFFDGELIGVISTEFVNDGENISFKTQFTPS